MYNPITEEKIKGIPRIGNINTDTLPDELTRIYAKVVSLRRRFADGTIDFLEGSFEDDIQILQTLANNLETILITLEKTDNKESIGFVAATANGLLYRISQRYKVGDRNLFSIDSISSSISAVLLFLIGNSQPDATEVAEQIINPEAQNEIHKHLLQYIQALAKGNLTQIVNNPSIEIPDEPDLQDAALNYLWRQIALGIYNIARQLLGGEYSEELSGSFDRVIDLSISETSYFGYRSVFAGPYQLAKLLKLLEDEILNRAVVKIPAPSGTDGILWQSFLFELAKHRPYLWENHRQVIASNFLSSGISAVLTLPTGAGKSTLSELKIASCLFSGKKVIYLVPTHALEDQTRRNLKPLFENVDLSNIEFDGEYSEIIQMDSFPIIVMTPERCLSFLNMELQDFNDVGLVVFDEFHLIHGKDLKRDSRSIDAMYCLLLLLTTIPDADFLLISAMVQNGDEIAEWISKATGRDCRLFNSSWKPTRQLQGCVIYEEKDVNALNAEIQVAEKNRRTISPPIALQKKMGIQPHCFFSLKNIWESNSRRDYYNTTLTEKNVFLKATKNWQNNWILTPNRNQVAAYLAVHFTGMGLKTLVFVDDPRIAYSTLKFINTNLNYTRSGYISFLDENRDILAGLATELGSIEYSYFDKQPNVGIHHGRLLSVERSIIEQYFKRSDGSICMVATATLAQGVNLPAEIVIIAGDDRFDEETSRRQRILPHEILNAAGRAGRAGHSSQGAVILIPGEIVTIAGSKVSQRWWELKDEVFSQSDQCLKIEDPLEYFLDAINEVGELTDEQVNVLYRFRSDQSPKLDAKALFQKSFYGFLANKSTEKKALFDEKLEGLVQRKKVIDEQSQDIEWTREISYKTGINPNVILEIGKSIDKEELKDFLNLSVPEFVDWYLLWLSENESNFRGIFNKPSILFQLNKAVGLRPDNENIQDVIKYLPNLKLILKDYLEGYSFESITRKMISLNQKILTDPFLTPARNFVLRLVPELSFSFGVLSQIIIEKAKENGIEKKDIPWTVKALATCIREGFDTVEKLFFKINKQILFRVEAHNKYLIS